MLQHSLLSLLLISSVSCQCSDNDTSIASVQFKDCMDQKQAAVLQINLETDNRLSVFCEGLDQFSTGCKEVVERFSECKSHHYVHNLVAIHIKSMAGENHDQKVPWDLDALQTINTKQSSFQNCCPSWIQEWTCNPVKCSEDPSPLCLFIT